MGVPDGQIGSVKNWNCGSASNRSKMYSQSRGAAATHAQERFELPAEREPAQEVAVLGRKRLAVQSAAARALGLNRAASGRRTAESWFPSSTISQRLRTSFQAFAQGSRRSRSRPQAQDPPHAALVDGLEDGLGGLRDSRERPI
jgi:hypothetical protein